MNDSKASRAAITKIEADAAGQYADSASSAAPRVLTGDEDAAF